MINGSQNIVDISPSFGVLTTFTPPVHSEIYGLASLLLFPAAQLKQGMMFQKKIFLFIVAISTLSLLLHRGIQSSWYVRTETHQFAHIKHSLQSPMLVLVLLL